MVNPGNSAHRHQARSKTDQARPHHRMVTLAQSSPGDRSARAHQSKTATVMLERRPLRTTQRSIGGQMLSGRSLRLDFTPGVVATRATTANGEIGFSSSRDVCRVTIHSDARCLCPNRNDGHDLRAPYARDHHRGRRVPERCRRRFAQRREPAVTSASPRPVASVLSPMRRERRQRSAENDSFGISPLGRGCAAQGNVPAPRKFRPKQR
jgi:hypothetical protein